MTSVPATDTADEALTLADIDATTGKNPDPTGDFAARLIFRLAKAHSGCRIWIADDLVIVDVYPKQLL